MKSNQEYSSFLQAAMALDKTFSEFSALSQKLEAAEIETEFGMKQAKNTAEAAAQNITLHANRVQQRDQENEKILERFHAMGEMTRKVTEGVSKIFQGNPNLTTEEKAALTNHVPTLITQLEMLVEESSKIKNDAKAANLKNIEKNATSLVQTLTTIRSKLAQSISLH